MVFLAGVFFAAFFAGVFGGSPLGARVDLLTGSGRAGLLLRNALFFDFLGSGVLSEATLLPPWITVTQILLPGPLL